MLLAGDGSQRRVRSIVAICLILTMAVMIVMRPASAAGSASTTGIMIPLYTYPGSTWTSVAAIQQANPNVPIVAIVNPDSGPGSSKDPNYSAGIEALQTAGVTVLGYVPTGYTARSISEVESMVDSYKSWYPVTGIFFDEMSNVPGQESYYSTLNAYVKSLGFSHTVGNPGADTAPSYVGTLDTIVIYENQGLPDVSYLRGWHSDYAKGNFAIMAYGVQTVDPSYPSATSPFVGYIYITDAGLPNPYDALPPYLAAVATDLATVATTGSATTTTATTTITTGTVTSLTTVTSTSTAVTTSTSTTTTTTTMTATAQTTTTTTDTAAATTTTTATEQDNVTTTSTLVETTTITRTETATATETTTTLSTVTGIATTEAAASPSDVAPSRTVPEAGSGWQTAIGNLVSSLGSFASAETQLWGSMLAHALSVLSQQLRLALSHL